MNFRKVEAIMRKSDGKNVVKSKSRTDTLFKCHLRQWLGFLLHENPPDKNRKSGRAEDELRQRRRQRRRDLVKL